MVMPFTIRPFRRFPVCCPTTYQVGDFEGQGIVWNLSARGWRLSGDLPLRSDEICSLTVTLPTESQVYVAAGIVRWVRGEEFGLETLVMDEESRMDLYAYLDDRIAE
jgi:hypothetical protein